MGENYAETIDTSHLDDSNRKSTLTKQKKIDIRSNLKQLIDLAFPTNEQDVIIELDQDVNYLLTKFKEIYILYKLYHVKLLRKEETKKKKRVITIVIRPSILKYLFRNKESIRSQRESEVWLIWWFSFIQQKLLWQMSLRKKRRLQVLK